MEKTLTKKESFFKSLNNFISKSPLNLQLFTSNDDSTCFVRIIVDGENKEDVVLNISGDKKKEIELLKNITYKYLPILWTITYTTPSIDKLESLISEGKLTLKEALSYKEQKETNFGKLIRVHNKYNEIDVEDFTTKEILKYKSKIPLFMLLNDIKNNKGKIDTNNIVFVKNISKMEVK